MPTNPETSSTPSPALIQRLLDALDALSGLHAGFRPARAKGALCSGTLTPSPEAVTLTRATHDTAIDSYHRSFLGLLRLADGRRQRPAAGQPTAPGAVAGRGNLPRFAEEAHGPLIAVLVHEAEGPSASVVKNAAAFFKRSRSAQRRWFSATA